MRRDHEALALLSVTLAEVGSPLTLLVDVRRDGVPTIRRSTIVREIGRLAVGRQ
jgi:hypothetical protein